MSRVTISESRSEKVNLKINGKSCIFLELLAEYPFSARAEIKIAIVKKLNHGHKINGNSISAKKESRSLCCMMGKTMSRGCHLLAANGFRLANILIEYRIRLN